jgi:divalent metal cation (Fe/Co/Zn/Cd) transporter
MTDTPLEASAAARRALLQRGLRLEYVTLAWNMVGSVLVLLAAAHARSVALAGFGLDSLIEIVASTVVVWQLKGSHKPREQKALRLIGTAFILLALYIGAQSVYVLAVAFRPHHSPFAIAWLALTAAAMLTLARANPAQAAQSPSVCSRPKRQ